MIKMLGTLPSPIASTNTQTVLTIPLSFPAGILPDATFASVSIQNGTNATLTQMALTFTPIVGGIPLALAYPVTVSVAAGAATTVQVPLTNGLDEAPSLTLTFASAPTSGNCAARVVLMPHAPQVGLTGSLAPLPWKLFNLYGTFDITTGSVTNAASPLSIAAGADYQSVPILAMGYRTITAWLNPASTNTSTDYQFSISPNLNGDVDFFAASPSLNGAGIAAVFFDSFNPPVNSDSYGTAGIPEYEIHISNNSTSASLVVGALGGYAQ